jgi:hypothetical protein
MGEDRDRQRPRPRGQQKRQMLLPITIGPFDRMKEWKLFDADHSRDKYIVQCVLAIASTKPRNTWQKK